MTIQRMVELLEIEHACMLRGSHNDCDRNCDDCELVQDDYELHEMYTEVISLLKKQEAKHVKVVKNAYNHEFYHCPRCDRSLYELFVKPNFCDKCGQELKWDADD